MAQQGAADSLTANFRRNGNVVDGDDPIPSAIKLAEPGDHRPDAGNNKLLPRGGADEGSAVDKPQSLFFAIRDGLDRRDVARRAGADDC